MALLWLETGGVLISLSKAVSRGYTTIVLHIVHLVRLSSLSSTSVAVIGDSAKPDLRLPSQLALVPTTAW